LMREPTHASNSNPGRDLSDMAGSKRLKQ